jgi:hypothetical protein
MEARAYARFQAEQAEHAAKLARRAGAAASGKPPRGRAPQAPDPAPQFKDRVNVTDPESRFMKTRAGFQQAYNAQAGVETAPRLIVGPRVSQAANDRRELLPNVATVPCYVLSDTLWVDRGFVSEAAVTARELATPGLTIHAALQPEPHDRSVAHREKRSDSRPRRRRHPWPNACVAARRPPAAVCPINSGSRPPNRSSASSKKCSVSAVSPCAVGPKSRRMGVGLPRLRLPTPPPPRRRPPPTWWPPAQETCSACPFPPPVFTRQEFRNLQARPPARHCRGEDAPHADDQPCGHGSP